MKGKNMGNKGFEKRFQVEEVKVDPAVFGNAPADSWVREPKFRIVDTAFPERPFVTVGHYVSRGSAQKKCDEMNATFKTWDATKILLVFFLLAFLPACGKQSGP